jgi:hypothetical protein
MHLESFLGHIQNVAQCTHIRSSHNLSANIFLKEFKYYKYNEQHSEQ